MLNITPDQLRELEKVYPGITRSIDHFESMQLPRCTHCGSPNTAYVMVGIVGRSINIATATSKAALIANGPKPGTHRCNACKKYFDFI
jgi:hypothetical protein